MQDYHQLEIWQRGMAVTVEIYRFITMLPDAERYNLASQSRKAATSVPLNIVEGAGCAGSNEFAKFLGYAYRSTKEIMTALELCQRLYPAVGADTVPAVIAEGDRIAPMTHGLIVRLAQPREIGDSASHRQPKTGNR